MNYNTLQAFLCIAETGSFSRAAAQLFISQPTLSNSIAALERELQFQLFFRNNRGVRLTPAGEAFYGRAKDIVKDTQAAILAGREAAGISGGSVKIGCNWHDTTFIFAPICEAFSSQYPQTELIFTHCAMNNIFSAFRNEGLDLCLAYNGDGLRENGLCFLPLFRDSLQCFLSPGHPLSAREALRPEDLSGERLVLPPLGVCGCADRLRGYIREKNLDISIEDGVNRDALPALLSGRRYAVLQPSWLKSHAKIEKALPFIFDSSLEVGLAYRQEAGPGVRHFLSAAKRLYAKEGRPSGAL